MIGDRIPGWMRQQKIAGGWLTAEYNMLPYSTLTRKDRPSSKGKQDGRNIKFKARSVDLCGPFWTPKLHEKTLWIDCGVLRADGEPAPHRLQELGLPPESPSPTCWSKGKSTRTQSWITLRQSASAFNDHYLLTWITLRIGMQPLMQAS